MTIKAPHPCLWSLDPYSGESIHVWNLMSHQQCGEEGVWPAAGEAPSLNYTEPDEATLQQTYPERPPRADISS